MPFPAPPSAPYQNIHVNVIYITCVEDPLLQ